MGRVYKTFTHAHLVYDAAGKVDLAASGNTGYDRTNAIVLGAPTPYPDAIH